MSGRICDPKQSSAVAHAQPSIDIAAHLNDGRLTRRHFPALKRRWILWNKRSLRQSRRLEIALQIETPGFKLFVLFFQLPSHFAQAQLCLDVR